jgi:hypothetical protein
MDIWTYDFVNSKPGVVIAYVVFVALTIYTWFWVINGFMKAVTNKENKAMPVGTVLVTTHRYDLKSCPEGYVVVRRMNYGEELQRTEMATKFTLGGAGNNVDKDSFSGALDINTTAVALWDFANLIIDHNITDETEKLLNFKNPNDVKRLDSTVGKEIGEAIDEWNAAKDTQDTKNS